MSVRIICINKANGQHENPYIAISRLGWVADGTGNTGNSSREEMYDFIKNQKGEAYVQAGTARAALIAEISPRGNRFVKTRADSTVQDNLLKLPECS
jgi:hypothetical protein